MNNHLNNTKLLTDEQRNQCLENCPNWEINSLKTKISRKFVRKNFISAIELINQIAEIAENENHHPDIHLTNYKTVTIELSTHSANGLTENDFIIANKINDLL